MGWGAEVGERLERFVYMKSGSPREAKLQLDQTEHALYILNVSSNLNRQPPNCVINIKRPFEKKKTPSFAYLILIQ